MERMESIVAACEAEQKPQRILVFQQNGSGEFKIKGIREHGGSLFQLEIFSVDEPLPPIVDDPEEYLSPKLDGDLVLDFFRHPDLSHELAKRCAEADIPCIASGKKLDIRSAITPPTCCGLARQVGLGIYGELFGAPRLKAQMGAGRIESLQVIRGAPCGATWDAASAILGTKSEDAAVRMGLEAQFFCGADTAGWDPMYGKSPIHFAGEMHSKALHRALVANFKEKKTVHKVIPPR